MKTIPAGEFKSKCLQLMDDVQRTRKPITITKRGKPVAKLVPVEQQKDEWFGRLKGRVRIVGDIESPIDPPEAWESSR
ncbi:MAG: type II toxin-antitoxin system prevent-host-death family antitoxin [Acidobacteria bacterium]|nr:MAG: type II toxin-antitoxin system prevent-host-death family antitoxin [Acidobacteriota bacterium]